MGKLTGKFNNVNDELITVSIDTKLNDILVGESFYDAEQSPDFNFMKYNSVNGTTLESTVPYWYNDTNIIYHTTNNTQINVVSDDWIVFDTNLEDNEGNSLYLHVDPLKISARLWLFKSGKSYVDIFGKYYKANTSTGIVYWQPRIPNYSMANSPLNYSWYNYSGFSLSKSKTDRSQVFSGDSLKLLSYTPKNNWYDIIFSKEADKMYATDGAGGQNQTCSIHFAKDDYNTKFYWHFKNYQMNLTDSANPVVALHPSIKSITTTSYFKPSSNADYSIVKDFLKNEIQPVFKNVGWLSNNFSSSIKFSDDPITIEENCQSTFDHVIKTTATVRFKTSKYLGDELWTGDFSSKGKITGPRNINGSRETNFTLFEGYLEPNTYSQPFANFVEELELNFVDYLTRLEDLKYNDVTPDTFADMLSDTKNITFRELLNKMLEVNGLDIAKFKIYTPVCVAYDTDGNKYDAFDCAVSENYLYGEDYDDTMTYGEILEEMMKYLNMHIKQLGNAWYIFRWDAIKPSEDLFDDDNDDGMGLLIVHEVPTDRYSCSNVDENGNRIEVDEWYYEVAKPISKKLNIKYNNKLLTISSWDDLYKANGNAWPQTIYILYRSTYVKYTFWYAGEYFNDPTSNYVPEKGHGFQLCDINNTDKIYNLSIAKNYLTALKSASNDANITLDEVFNQISLKCDMESIDNIIQSPLDSDSLSSVYSTKQLFCREYLMENGLYKQADWDNFTTLVKNQHVDNVNYTLTDWYVQVMYSKFWSFNWHNNNYLNLFKYDSNGVGYKQYDLLEQSVKPENTMCPILLNVTKVENPTDVQDNDIKYSVSRSTCLYINVNGGATMLDKNGNTIRPLVSDSTWDNVKPTQSELESNAPIAEYISPRSGSILSPADDDTTNYLVFKGKISLLPAQKNAQTTFNFGQYTIQTNGDYLDLGIMKYDNYGTLLFKGDSTYGRRYFCLEYPSSNIYWSLLSMPDIGYKAITLKDMHCSINEKDYTPEYYKYNWTYLSKRSGHNYDKIKKLPILECELIIGNKRLIETDMDEEGNSTFKWVELGQEPEVNDYMEDDASFWTPYKVTTFSLGVNPKIGDFILGTEFDIQNTVDFTMNLEDIVGTAIPIKRSDNLSGKVTFRILGVVWLEFDDVVYRHRTWFRKVKYTSNVISLLKQVRSVCISDFECKIVSDNAGYDSAVKEDKDLVYMSAESDKAINVKDDIEFKFITQPTSAECREKNLKNSILQNAVILGNRPLATIEAQENAKPEELYIDYYYKEYSSPKLVLEQTIQGNTFVEWSGYKFTKLDKIFYIINKTEDVLNDTYTLKMKEI